MVLVAYLLQRCLMNKVVGWNTVLNLGMSILCHPKDL